MYYDEKTLCNSNLTIPLADQVVLSKSHYRNRRGQPHSSIFQSTIEQQSGDVPGGIAGVVRLARNPGDHLLRNFFRWDNRDCHSDKCFFRRAKATCRILQGKVSDWNQFHTYWNDYDASVPQMIMHYERFSTVSTAFQAFDEMMNFVRAEEGVPGTMRDKIQDNVR
jgi:hypothetical protein